MIVTTESGSQYEIETGRVRRINTGAVKRGDGEWQPLVTMTPNPPAVGSSLWLVMESLVRYGGDDIGTLLEDAAHVTTRRTTPVTKVSGSLDSLPSSNGPQS